jgi:heptosyltransferase II
MVMSTALLQALHQHYPNATIDVIAKKGIDFLLDYFPWQNQRYVFDKAVYSGLVGAYKFGKLVKQQKKYDLFICLPDSISSAVMGYATGAGIRIGYKKELRSILLTNSYDKIATQHRVQQYVHLLNQFLQKEIAVPNVFLQAKNSLQKKSGVVININSEASSRRLPVEKAVAIINAVKNKIKTPIKLIGGPADEAFVTEVYNKLSYNHEITNVAGTTSLQELIDIFASSSVVLTTDSGPAHIANALGTPVVVLFGAGNEKNTAPYNSQKCIVMRSGQLPCEPCVSNTCKLYSSPKCLQLLNENDIATQVAQLL